MQTFWPVFFFDRAVLLRFHARQDLGCFKERGEGGTLHYGSGVVLVGSAKGAPRWACLVVVVCCPDARLAIDDCDYSAPSCSVTADCMILPQTVGGHRNGIADAGVKYLRK